MSSSHIFDPVRKVLALLAVFWSYMKIHTHKHTQTQNPINLKWGHAARLWPPLSLYLSPSLSNIKTALSSSRTHSDFPKRVRSGEKQRTCSICRHQATGEKSHPQSVRQPESPAGQHADRPSDQQAGRINEARLGGGAEIGLCRW